MISPTIFLIFLPIVAMGLLIAVPLFTGGNTELPGYREAVIVALTALYLIVAMLCVAITYEYGNEMYEQGQIDAINGDMKYELNHKVIEEWQPTKTNR